MKIWLVALSGSILMAQTPAPLPDQARELERASRLYQLNVAVRAGNIDPIKGRPFSATEENRSTQILGNGARIENKSTTKLYRDADGRTRIERTDGTVTIMDPVAEFQATLNTRTQTATRGQARPVVLRAVRIDTSTPQGVGREKKEPLGVQLVNGISAVGERVTVTIPRGEIGNDRDLEVVTERWYSDALQMLVKSTNTDPRFGETVYELTGISQVSPDPALFQVPAGYTITEGGRGGARGGARGPAPGATAAPSVAPGTRGGRGQ